jgi:C4-dicarboxylate-specific signal transduction histidine kinase
MQQPPPDSASSKPGSSRQELRSPREALLSFLTHDLQNALATLTEGSGYLADLAALGTPVESAEAEEIASLLVRHSKRAATTARALATLARHQPAAGDRCELRHLLTERRNLFSSLAEALGSKLEITASDDPLSLRVGESTLTWTLLAASLQLLLAAAQPNQSTLRIEIMALERTVAISVTRASCSPHGWSEAGFAELQTWSHATCCRVEMRRDPSPTLLCHW